MSVAGAADKEMPPVAAAACDFCAGLPAVVYCRAESARLCLPCDRHVHGANTVSSRHARAPLGAALRRVSRRRGRVPPRRHRLPLRKLRLRGGAPAGRRPAAAPRSWRGGRVRRVPLDRRTRRHPRRRRVREGGGRGRGRVVACLGGAPGSPAGGRHRAHHLVPWPPAAPHAILPKGSKSAGTASTVHYPEKEFPHSSLMCKNPSSGRKLTEEVIRQLGELAKSEAAAMAFSEAEPADGEQLPSWASSEYGIGDGDFGAFDTDACHEAASMAVPSCEEAWIATDGNGACREAHEQAPAPAPASSLAEPCLLSSFVDMSEICPSMTLGGSVDVDNGSSKRDAAEAAPQQQASPAPAKKGGYDVAYPPTAAR